MTRERAKKLLPVIQAYAEGKSVQLRARDSVWEDISEPNFDGFARFEYRIKPEPTLRPWKPEEVPVGKLIKRKYWSGGWGPSLILGASIHGVEFIDNWQDSSFTRLPLNEILSECEHSTDNGATWKACGVQETTT